MRGSGHGDSQRQPRLEINLLRRDARPGAGGRLRQPLARALGMGKGRPNPPIILDATAGAGMDAWLIASLGCRVLSLERNAAIFRAGCEALEHARASSPETATRITRLNDDALLFFERLKNDDPDTQSLLTNALAQPHPDVVYLDPMFPLGRKTAEGKLLRATRAIVGDDDDADQLLPAAFAAALRRVVVKRPRRAAALATIPPTISHIGKGVRYDVYAKEDAAVIAAINRLADES